MPRFDYRVSFAARSDLGGSRSTQEDAFLVAPDLGVVAVADGMGGHAGGEVAAAIALEVVREVLGDRTSRRAADLYVATPSLEARRRIFGRLREAVERANNRIWTRAQTDPELTHMGCTVDVLWLVRHHVFGAHAGDGRIYLARRTATLQLTQDHELIEALRARTGSRAKPRARGGSRLMNALGLRETVSVDTLFVDVSRGDRLLVCTDGVHGPLESEAEIGQLLRDGSPQAAADALVAHAVKVGRDNATAIVLAVGDAFVRRDTPDKGFAAADLERARQSPLLENLPLPMVLATLAAALEVELPPGAEVPRLVANDLVSYVVLDGLVACSDARHVSTGALLFPESLVGVGGEGALPIVQEPARLLRVRADDFQEVCRTDPVLAAELYQRLATYLARSRTTRAATAGARLEP